MVGYIWLFFLEYTKKDIRLRFSPVYPVTEEEKLNSNLSSLDFSICTMRYLGDNAVSCEGNILRWS